MSSSRTNRRPVSRQITGTRLRVAPEEVERAERLREAGSRTQALRKELPDLLRTALVLGLTALEAELAEAS